MIHEPDKDSSKLTVAVPSIATAAVMQIKAEKGFIGAPPRWIAWVADALIEGLAEFLGFCEVVGLWPGATKQILLRRIPKGDGDTRLVGSLDWLVRAYEKTRRGT